MNTQVSRTRTVPRSVPGPFEARSARGMVKDGHGGAGGGPLSGLPCVGACRGDHDRVVAAGPAGL